MLAAVTSIMKSHVKNTTKINLPNLFALCNFFAFADEMSPSSFDFPFCYATKQFSFSGDQHTLLTTPS